MKDMRTGDGMYDMKGIQTSGGILMTAAPSAGAAPLSRRPVRHMNNDERGAAEDALYAPNAPASMARRQ
jgi:hypothetical protein